jgi:malate dehydrogenase (oxaloacetate-decarboxylating)(NADP+)
MDSGVATRPIDDFAAYQRSLQNFVYRTGMVMRPVFERAINNPRRVIYAEGESRRVLQAAQVLVDDGICRPLLIGRPGRIEELIGELGLRLAAGRDFDIVELAANPHYERDWRLLHELNSRGGITPDHAQTLVLTNPTVVAALYVRQCEADAMLCGLSGRFNEHLERMRSVFELRKRATDCSTINLLCLRSGNYFIADTHVNYEPTPEQIAETAILGADIVRRFGLEPRIALLSHSNFGSSGHASADKMRKALALLRKKAPQLEIEGEMQGDAAILEAVRRRVFPESIFTGTPNLLLMPNLDAANIGYNLVRSLENAVTVGPILVGFKRAGHILTPSVTVRGIVNMSAVAVVHALDLEQGTQARRDSRPSSGLQRDS